MMWKKIKNILDIHIGNLVLWEQINGTKEICVYGTNRSLNCIKGTWKFFIPYKNIKKNILSFKNNDDEDIGKIIAYAKVDIPNDIQIIDE